MSKSTNFLNVTWCTTGFFFLFMLPIPPIIVFCTAIKLFFIIFVLRVLFEFVIDGLDKDGLLMEYGISSVSREDFLVPSVLDDELEIACDAAIFDTNAFLEEKEALIME